MKPIRPLLPAVFLAAALMPFVSWNGTAEAQDLQRITVVLPNPSALNVWPMHVAIGEGYMAEEGLELEVHAVDGSAPVLQTMAAGQAQIGLPGPAPVLAARSRGEDVVFIYNLNPISSFGIVVKEESEYQSPEDLKGQVVGVGTADGAEVSFARSIFSDVGMTEGEDYTFLPVGDGGPATVGFERGDIEAYAAATSDAAIMTTRGLNLREITPEKFMGFFANGYAVQRSYMEENPEVIEAFGRAIVKGTRFGLDPANREAVLAHAAEANPQEGEDTELANALFDQLLIKMVPGDQGAFGYQPPENWEAWQQSLLDSGGLSEAQDLSRAYTNEFVETWNAE